LLKWKSVGHAGTLDPAATGLLIVLCGNATPRASEFSALPKEYSGVIRLGVTTTTDDLEGEVTAESTVTCTSASIQQAVERLRGEIMQIPPAYSAIKVGGKRSYKLARAGREVELAARPVTVYSFDVTATSAYDLSFVVCCSAGTYIRSLARDVGRDLGCGGTLAKLRRTAIGPYCVDCAFTLSEIQLRRAEFAAP
jgi:tRNA pseudouridine55 synthase